MSVDEQSEDSISIMVSLHQHQNGNGKSVIGTVITVIPSLKSNAGLNKCNEWMTWMAEMDHLIV